MLIMSLLTVRRAPGEVLVAPTTQGLFFARSAGLLKILRYISEPAKSLSGGLFYCVITDRRHMPGPDGPLYGTGVGG